MRVEERIKGVCAGAVNCSAGRHDRRSAKASVMRGGEGGGAAEGKPEVSDGLIPDGRQGSCCKGMGE